jgi:branched-chain amino acid transport system ATP-binding protein
MFRIENITAGYGDITILHDISLEIQKGEIVSLVGANAAGKSTLLRAISGLIEVTEGAIWFEGERIDQLEIKDRVAKGLIQIPEGRELFPGMSVQDNLLMGAFSKEHRKDANKKLGKVYELFPRLKERYKQMAGSLSGGEQQMVAIGRGLMSDPKLLMLDEPSLGLAPIIVQQMIQVIKQINEDMGTAIFLVEQNVNHALKLAQRGYVLENGKIVMSGSGRELLENDHIRKAYLGI